MGHYLYPQVPQSSQSQSQAQQRQAALDDGRFSWVQTPAEARGRTWQTETEVPPLPQVPDHLNANVTQRDPSPQVFQSRIEDQQQEQMVYQSQTQDLQERQSRQGRSQPPPQQRQKQRSRASSSRRESNAQYSLFPQSEANQSQQHIKPEIHEPEPVQQDTKPEPEQYLAPPALPQEQVDSPVDPYMHQPLYQPDIKPRLQTQLHTEPQRSPTQLKPTSIPLHPDENPLSPTTPSKSPIFPTTPISMRNTNMPVIPTSATSPFTTTTFPTVSQPLKHGTFHTTLSSCSPYPLTCLTSLFCPCIVYGRTQYRLTQKSERHDPTNMLGYSTVNGSCIALSIPLLGGLLAAIQHTRVRKVYEMDKGSGNVGSDLVKGCCCLCCVVAVDEREVRLREEGEGKKWKGIGSSDDEGSSGIGGYVPPGGMTFAPPPVREVR